MNRDPEDLERFAIAQAGVYDTALAELRAGRKRTHWMWFVFPQLRGLGSSHMAQFYGIASLDEARRFLAHPVLGPRLVACVDEVTGSSASSLRALFGTPDDLKFHSCATLFGRAAGPGGGAFRRALDRWFEGAADPRTVDLLER